MEHDPSIYLSPSMPKHAFTFNYPPVAKAPISSSPSIQQRPAVGSRGLPVDRNILEIDEIYEYLDEKGVALPPYVEDPVITGKANTGFAPLSDPDTFFAGCDGASELINLTSNCTQLTNSSPPEQQLQNCEVNELINPAALNIEITENQDTRILNSDNTHEKELLSKFLVSTESGSSKQTSGTITKEAELDHPTQSNGMRELDDGADRNRGLLPIVSEFEGNQFSQFNSIRNTRDGENYDLVFANGSEISGGIPDKYGNASDLSLEQVGDQKGPERSMEVGDGQDAICSPFMAAEAAVKLSSAVPITPLPDRSRAAKTQIPMQQVITPMADEHASTFSPSLAVDSHSATDAWASTASVVMQENVDRCYVSAMAQKAGIEIPTGLDPLDPGILLLLQDRIDLNPELTQGELQLPQLYQQLTELDNITSPGSRETDANIQSPVCEPSSHTVLGKRAREDEDNEQDIFSPKRPCNPIQVSSEAIEIARTDVLRTELNDGMSPSELRGSGVEKRQSILNEAATICGTIAPKTRFTKGAKPAKYCHICGRHSRTVAFISCVNIPVGLCRKIVCQKCLITYEPQNEMGIHDKEFEWTCTHCRGVCPMQARCKRYAKNNLRRRAKTEQKRREENGEFADS